MSPRRRRARGHIEELRWGSYRAVVCAGINQTASSYAQAKVALTKLQRDVDEDAHPKTKLTIGQAIWLDVAEHEDTTRERYNDLIRLYVVPTFGNLPAAKLAAELLERFCARLHRCRELCSDRTRSGHTCRPLSTSTTRKIRYIIRGALERAVRWRHLGVNKAVLAVAPSPERTRGVRRAGATRGQT
jgi:integrase